MSLGVRQPQLPIRKAAAAATALQTDGETSTFVGGVDRTACISGFSTNTLFANLALASAVTAMSAGQMMGQPPEGCSCAMACSAGYAVARMTNTTSKAPWHLWVIGVIALLFNSIGVFDFVMAMTQGAKYMASAGMTPEQIAHYEGMPVWMTAVWTIGVWGAFLASVLLLLRRKLAFPVFVLSLAAFLISLVYTYVLTDGGAIMGQQMAITSAVIAALLLLFSWYAHSMGTRGVLR
jgi:hypothetical protein